LALSVGWRCAPSHECTSGFRGVRMPPTTSRMFPSRCLLKPINPPLNRVELLILARRRTTPFASCCACSRFSPLADRRFVARHAYRPAQSSPLRRGIYFPPPGLSYFGSKEFGCGRAVIRKHSRHEMSCISSPSVRSRANPFSYSSWNSSRYSGQPVTPQPLTDAEYNRFGDLLDSGSRLCPMPLQHSPLAWDDGSSLGGNPPMG
jgi:hypothetical protein